MRYGASLRASIVFASCLGTILSGCGEIDRAPSPPLVTSPPPAPIADADSSLIVAEAPPPPVYNPDGTLSSETMRQVSGTIEKRSADEYISYVQGKQIRGDLRAGVDALNRMPWLRTLWVEDVSEVGLTKSDYQEISRLHRLNMLLVEGLRPIDAAALAPLAEMPNLKTLEFEEAHVSPEAVAPLAESRSLEELRIGTGWGIREEAERLGVRFRVVHTQNYEP